MIDDDEGRKSLSNGSSWDLFIASVCLVTQICQHCDLVLLLLWVAAVSAVSQRSVVDVCCQCWRRRSLAVLKTWLQWKVRRSGLAVLYHLCPLHQSAGSRALSPWPLWPMTGQ